MFLLVIKPDIFADIVRRKITEGLFDLSVSRPQSRLSWGIPVPDDDSQVVIYIKFIYFLVHLVYFFFFILISKIHMNVG